jgi:hypothetical protein
MIRGVYQWNRIFQNGGITPATLLLLFRFSGTAGNLAPGGALDDPNSGNTALPTNWIADFRRLYDFAEAGRNDLIVSPEKFNLAKRIDTALVDPLATLPVGTFGGRGGAAPPPEQLNLAFRNLTRGNMVRLASGQQMAAQLEVKPLSSTQILDGAGGAELSSLTETEKESLLENTPLWFYVLREAELNGGRMTGVGGRIVAEVFHRAMQASSNSILWDPTWRPTLGPDKKTFRMVDLLLFAYDGKAELLNPMGD